MAVLLSAVYISSTMLRCVDDMEKQIVDIQNIPEKQRKNMYTTMGFVKDNVFNPELFNRLIPQIYKTQYEEIQLDENGVKVPIGVSPMMRTWYGKEASDKEDVDYDTLASRFVFVLPFHIFCELKMWLRHVGQVATISFITSVHYPSSEFLWEQFDVQDYKGQFRSESGRIGSSGECAWVYGEMICGKRGVPYYEDGPTTKGEIPVFYPGRYERHKCTLATSMLGYNGNRTAFIAVPNTLVSIVYVATNTPLNISIDGHKTRDFNCLLAIDDPVPKIGIGAGVYDALVFCFAYMSHGEGLYGYIPTCQRDLIDIAEERRRISMRDERKRRERETAMKDHPTLLQNRHDHGFYEPVSQVRAFSEESTVPADSSWEEEDVKRSLKKRRT